MVFTVALALVTLCIIAMLDRLEDFLHYKFENAATQTFQSRETRALEWLRFNFPFAPKQKGDATTYRHVFRRMMAGIEHAPTALGDIQGAIARPADETFEGRVGSLPLSWTNSRFVSFVFGIDVNFEHFLFQEMVR